MKIYANLFSRLGRTARVFTLSNERRIIFAMPAAMNSRFFIPALGLSLALMPAARAQGVLDPGVVDPLGRNPIVGAPGQGDVATPARPTNVVNINANNLAQLPTLLNRAGAISLGVYADDLDKNPAARDALLNYVGQGGTVFLHTDAARLFGYRTVAARETTNRQVGQLYGRARAAVPFGTVPLLWNDGANAVRGPVRAPGINTVFYTLRAGDDLVIDHPAGTPLLQVSGSGANSPLYAAAIAPYGAGWAVFTPDFIDQTRGDGAAFARNLLKLVGGSRYVGVSQAAIGSGDGLLAELSRAAQNGNGQSAPLPGIGTNLPTARAGGNGAAMGEAPVATQNGQPMMDQNSPMMAGSPATAAPGPVLLLTRNEATAFGTALQNDPQGRGAVALAILRARVALLNGDAQSAQTQLALADRLAPNTGEIQFLRGAAAIAGATFIGSVSPDRASSANLAANSFASAGRAKPYFLSLSAANGVFFDNITGANLNSLGAQINRFSQVLGLEPPLSLVVGNGASAVTIRYFDGDSAVPFVERAAADLARSELFSGLVDGQEILLFPTPQLYQRYRAAAGLEQQNVPLPAASLGDVVDGRILMVSIPAARPITIGPGGVPRVLPLRATSANLLARFETYALFDSYLGDSNGRIPSWMVLGFSTLADLTVNGDTLSSQYDQELRRYATTGNLLAPRQFDAQLGDSSLLALAQSTAIMRFFYARFGAGRVAETIQRIGAGQNVDDALTATTGLDELGLFREWRSAQFDGLNLRN